MPEYDRQLIVHVKVTAQSATDANKVVSDLKKHIRGKKIEIPEGETRTTAVKNVPIHERRTCW